MTQAYCQVCQGVFPVTALEEGACATCRRTLESKNVTHPVFTASDLDWHGSRSYVGWIVLGVFGSGLLLGAWWLARPQSFDDTGVIWQTPDDVLEAYLEAGHEREVADLLATQRRLMEREVRQLLAQAAGLKSEEALKRSLLSRPRAVGGHLLTVVWVRGSPWVRATPEPPFTLHRVWGINGKTALSAEGPVDISATTNPEEGF